MTIWLSTGKITIDSEPGSFIYKSDNPAFEVKQDKQILEIKTDRCKLIYTKGEGAALDRIQLQFSRDNEEVSCFINQKDHQNLGGIIKSVDRCDGRQEYKEYDWESDTSPLQMPNGLLSQRGWTVLKNIDGKLVHADEDTPVDAFLCSVTGITTNRH